MLSGFLAQRLGELGVVHQEVLLQGDVAQGLTWRRWRGHRRGNRSDRERGGWSAEGGWGVCPDSAPG